MPLKGMRNKAMAPILLLINPKGNQKITLTTFQFTVFIGNKVGQNLHCDFEDRYRRQSCICVFSLP